MKKLFIHHPLFRLLSPLFSGLIVYLFILLINNNVEQLQEQFLSTELYVCIGLSFIIQELSRLLLLVFNRLSGRISSIYSLAVQIISSLILCIVVVSLAINLYYKKTLGYAPNNDEFLLFNSIFCTVTLIYILLQLSHQYLYKVNTKKLNEEMIRKQLIEEDFVKFKNVVKPDLLFSSLESIISLLKDNKNNIDNLIDCMASTYRYILSHNKRQLTNINEEIDALRELVKLFEYLPYRLVKLDNKITSSFLVVPGSLLNLVEYIVKHSISTIKDPLKLILSETEKHIEISYHYKDKIVQPFNINDLEELKHVYEIYSLENILFSEANGKRTVAFPKLYLEEQ